MGDRERRFAAGRADPRPGPLQRPGARERARAVVHGDRRRAGVRVGGRGRRPDALARSATSTNIVSPIDHPNAGLVSADRHSALVQFDVRGKAEDAEDKIAPILAAIDGAQAGNPSVIIEEFGQASADHQLDQRFANDMGRAEITSLPLTLGILVVAFGALVAAGLPVLLAFSAVLAATGLNSLVSHVVPDRPADAQRDHPHDRHGRRDRLLALLPAARARGASARARRRTKRCSAPRAPPARRCWSPARPC